MHLAGGGSPRGEIIGTNYKYDALKHKTMTESYDIWLF